MTAPAEPLITLSNCGCCEGIAVETPAGIENRPGLSAIAYRVGTQPQFKASMIAQLSGSGLTELRKLRTRDDDDFTIALLDSWAMVCDVLSFYQERIANESYLLTATERNSILNLARLIGYKLRPGVAASTYLAFTLETGVGSPESVTVDTRTKVQSIPGPGEKPQTFETIESIEARGEWNELKPRLTKLVLPATGDTQTYLQGVTTLLKPGDPLLVVGRERAKNVNNENWEIRRVSAIEADADNKRTLVSWSEPLGSRMPPVAAPKDGPAVFALRTRASIFGVNAPLWKQLPVALRVGETNPDPKTSQSNPFFAGVYAGRDTSWADARFAAKTTTINLDSVYKQIVPNSWIVLVKPESLPDGVTDNKKALPAYAEVYGVGTVGDEAKADFNISAKTTRLEISGENIEKFAPRDTTVLSESEELPLAETPISEAVWKDTIELNNLITPLVAGRCIVVNGRRMRARVTEKLKTLSLVPTDDLKSPRSLKPGDELIVLGLPEDSAQGPNTKHWHLMDQDGLEGHVDAADGAIELAASVDNDEKVSEVATIKSTGPGEDLVHSSLNLAANLTNVFDRATVTINANVAQATHGETVPGEVLGSGDAGQPYQRFVLRNSPLTYTSADTPSGGQTTLEVRVNDLKWDEVPTLFGRGPRERIYITQTGDDQKTTLEFGDGVTGARLPMGYENIKATYRRGIGLEGLVKAGQLSLLMTRPLGLKSVINPLAATGAQDPQSLSDARANSPLTVLTLDRIVSLTDYEDFASSFSGIAKALATWTWNQHTRGVFLTVSGIDGAEVDQKLHDTLLSAILKFAGPYVPITIKSFVAVSFKVEADLKIDPARTKELVLANVESALRTTFSFAARTFGQPVTLSEVVSAMQNVEGVIAVDVNKLFRTGDLETKNDLLVASAPSPGEDSAKAEGAELLTLDRAPLQLGDMP
jgi:hypothetical protein